MNLPAWFRHLPNAITVARLLLVPPVVWALVEGRHGLAFWLFAVAGLSDGIDGVLARRCGWTSRFGAIADPLADKLLMGSCFVTLALIGLVPAWLTALVLLRDLVIVTGAAVYHRLWGPFAFAPTRLGKLSTVAQVAMLFTLLLHLAGLPVVSAPAGALVLPLTWVVAGFAVASGADYVVTWSRRAMAASGEQR